MQQNTKTKILETCVKKYALLGDDGVSVREIAMEVGIAPSVLYHYFKDKHELLLEMYLHANKSLGESRAQLPQTKSLEDLFKQRIVFQFEQSEKIVAVLKYFLNQKSTFTKTKDGFAPDKAYLHIQEVLEEGVAQGIYLDSKIPEQSKVITHAINGFVLEYYPYKLRGIELQSLVNTIYNFLHRGVLKKGGENI